MTWRNRQRLEGASLRGLSVRWHLRAGREQAIACRGLSKRWKVKGLHRENGPVPHATCKLSLASPCGVPLGTMSSLNMDKLGAIHRGPTMHRRNSSRLGDIARPLPTRPLGILVLVLGSDLSSFLLPLLLRSCYPV